MLVCEDADPTPFKRSPETDSLSSAAEGGILSMPEGLLSLVNPAALTSSARAEYSAWVSGIGRMPVESKVCTFGFSLSFALSLPDRGAGALGKYAEKFCVARDIVSEW